MRLIDADELKKNFQDELCKGIACAECSMRVEGFCRAERWIDIAPTVEAEPTLIKEYCRKRCLIVIDSALFNEMKSRWSAEPIKHGHWMDAGESKLHCSYCHRYVRRIIPRGYDYCPNCGAKMDEVE